MSKIQILLYTKFGAIAVFHFQVHPFIGIPGLSNSEIIGKVLGRYRR
jgi:hypothetical protein